MKKNTLSSASTYVTYLKKVIKTLGTSEPDFYNADSVQLRQWQVQINNDAVFLSYSMSFRNDLKAALKAYISYRISN